MTMGTRNWIFFYDSAVRRLGSQIAVTDQQVMFTLNFPNQINIEFDRAVRECTSGSYAPIGIVD
jgi:hypothetical protein